MKRLVPLFALVIVLAGCATVSQPSATYDVSLAEVERPASFQDRYGPPEITKVDTAGVSRYVYEDSLITIGWLPTRNQLNFILENKSPHSIKLLWDEAAFVNADGTSERVMHAGVKYSEANNSHPPSVIVRGGRISDLVLPTSNVYYSSGQYGGWRERPLFPMFDYAQAQSLEGKSIQVLLPLEIQGTVNEYVFTFRVNDVTIPARQ